jgi:hypothetical protein
MVRDDGENGALGWNIEGCAMQSWGEQARVAASRYRCFDGWISLSSPETCNGWQAGFQLLQPASDSGLFLGPALSMPSAHGGGPS